MVLWKEELERKMETNNVIKLLITGKNSYIGTSLENWLLKSSSNYNIDTIDMKDGSWRDYDFSNYDSILHVAGIVHKKETKDTKDLYFVVNRDLAYETAMKAKEAGAKQFIFMSSMSVYGLETGVITRNTIPNPKNAYGKSKYEAEILIKDLEDKTFKVAILRPPMVYGKKSKGNYQLLSNFAKKSPIFPNYQNKRSMIYIDNLSEYLKVLIDNESQGLFFPQNKEYVCTSEMVKCISAVHNKKIRMTKIFNPFINLFIEYSLIKKVFGNLIYEIEDIESGIGLMSFEETIESTERLKEEF